MSYSENFYKWSCAFLRGCLGGFLGFALYSSASFWLTNNHLLLTQWVFGLNLLVLDVLSIWLLMMSGHCIGRLSGFSAVHIKKVNVQQAPSHIYGAFMFFLSWTISVTMIQRIFEPMFLNPTGHWVMSFTPGFSDLFRLLMLVVLAGFIFIFKRGAALAK